MYSTSVFESAQWAESLCQEDGGFSAHHLLQQSYLVQVFLLALQHRWQGDHFLFTGRSNEIFKTGQNVLLNLASVPTGALIYKGNLILGLNRTRFWPN